MRPVIIRLLAIVAAGLLVPIRAATPLPPSADAATITLRGIVTTRDKGTYQEHPFDVPRGVSRIDVDFTYDNRGKGTELEVGLFDPQRFRGTSRFSKDHFHLTEFEATPSYAVGPLPAGRWRLSLGIPSIGVGQSTTWTATVRMSMRSTPVEGLGPVLRNTADWYVGDLHAHTLHSDGFGCVDPGTTIARGCQPWEVVEEARARHLDFFAITDHNTTSHHADLATLQEGLTSMLLLRGQELTTFRGHANIYGTSRPIDFRLGFNGRSMTDVMDDVAREHALLSINHPGRETGDSCTGCGWDAPATPWNRIKAMEVVNGGVIEGKTAGMPFWYARLNEGNRITAIGGSDDHGARSPRGHIGSPATVIYASQLSEAALLDGIRSGRVYIRTRGPEGPRLELTARTAESVVEMGGIVRADAGGTPVRLTVHAVGAAGQRVEIVRNGELIAAQPVESKDQVLPFDVTLKAGQWAHVRLRDAQGITALTNPIYSASRP